MKRHVSRDCVQPVRACRPGAGPPEMTGDLQHGLSDSTAMVTDADVHRTVMKSPSDRRAVALRADHVDNDSPIERVVALGGPKPERLKRCQDASFLSRKSQGLR